MSVKLRPGDVVLVAFPFTDLSTTKVRPAVVVSSALALSTSSDVCLCFVSSVIPAVQQPYDVVFDEADPEFAGTGLKRLSVLRAHRLATLARGLVQRRLGRLGPDGTKRTREALAAAQL